MKLGALRIVSPILLILALAAVLLGIFSAWNRPVCGIAAGSLVLADIILVSVFGRCLHCNGKLRRNAIYAPKCPHCHRDLSAGGKP